MDKFIRKLVTADLSEEYRLRRLGIIQDNLMSWFHYIEEFQESESIKIKAKISRLREMIAEAELEEQELLELGRKRKGIV